MVGLGDAEYKWETYRQPLRYTTRGTHNLHARSDWLTLLQQFEELSTVSDRNPP